MAARLDWDEERKVLFVRRWPGATLRIGPGGVDGPTGIERNRIRRVVLERRGFGVRSGLTLLAQVRGAGGNEELVLAQLPAISDPDRETLLRRLAGLDLRPLLRSEHGPAPGSRRDPALTESEAAFVGGAWLPPGCAFIKAHDAGLGQVLAVVVALLGIATVIFGILVCGGSVSIPALLGLTATAAGLSFVGGFGRRGTFQKRPIEGWWIASEEGLYLLEDHLLVWACGRSQRIARDAFVGAELRKPPGQLGTVVLRAREGDRKFEIDLCELAPGRFPPSRWPELVQRCQEWRRPFE